MSEERRIEHTDREEDPQLPRLLHEVVVFSFLFFFFLSVTINSLEKQKRIVILKHNRQIALEDGWLPVIQLQIKFQA